jgi:ribosomal protein S6
MSKTEEAVEIVPRVYEAGYLIVPGKENAVEEALAAVRAMIEKQGGSFIAEGAPSLIRLAYTISRREGEKRADYDTAHFGWLKFECAPQGAKALESLLKEEKRIIRSIVFRTVREDTRAVMRMPVIREVKRTDTLRATRRAPEAAAAPVSEEKLDQALENLTVE